MPSLLDPLFAQIIPLLPVGQHSVRVGAALWHPHFVGAELHAYFDEIFDGNASIRLSRDRLSDFAYHNQQQKCLEIMLWGYPLGMRGNQHLAFLQNIVEIAALAQTEADMQWGEFYNGLHALRNLGIATITKIAYFYNRNFNGDSSLILDERVISVCAGAQWVELAPLQ